MNSFSFSVYRITINKYLKKKELENLSNFDNGKNLLGLIDTMFLSWKDEKEVSPVVKDEKSKKVSRLKKDKNGDWIYHFHQSHIEGIIESGEYGTQEDIINVETGLSRYTKTTMDASLVPFYFMLYIEPNSNEGYLILERIGNIGILSIIDKEIRAFISPQLSQQYTLPIEPYLMPKVLEINLASSGGAKKVVLKGVKNNQFKNFVPSDGFSECTTEVSFIAPRNRFIQQFRNVIDALQNKNDDDSYKINNVECKDVAFELDINGRRRTINVAKMTSIGMNVDITNNVELNAAGYPTYKSLSDEANVILSYLPK